MSPCPACTDKRVHTPADWAYHPYAGHGFNGSMWTHPDLEVLAGAASFGMANLGGGESVLQSAPAGGE
jgi:hypothetical protein